MKRPLLSLAVGSVATISVASANAAMYINDLGTGETLLFPFYSAENGNNTLINLANATKDHKAVKVRIVEAQNSQEVLDFNLYLSPQDHFSFAISEAPESVVDDGSGGTFTVGGAKMATGDRSCTSPAIPEAGEPFRTFLFKDDENNSVTRTQVGYIEVIEMGQLDPNATPVIDKAGIANGTAINAAAAITHDTNGVPANCDIVNFAWGSDGVWYAESRNTNLTGESEFLANWSGGGLYGYATVINVPQGAAFGYDAIAIADHVADGAAGYAMHYEPGDIRPNFTDSAMDTAAIVSVNGQAVTLDYSGDYPSTGVERIQAMNATIMATELYNDYVTDPAIDATTDWLLTFPTKAFHVNGTEPIQPFSQQWVGNSACEPAALYSVDREESQPAEPPAPGPSGPDFSPAPPTPPDPAPSNNDVPLCYESTIIQFATESAAGTSQVAVGVNSFLEADNGWAVISFDPDHIASTLAKCDIDGDESANLDAKEPCTRTIDAGDGQLIGLPVVGFAVQKYVNGNADGSGVLANYAISTAHKKCRSGTGTVANNCSDR